MTIEIRVPALGESITEATVTTWFKRLGETVFADEPILELETDKVTIEINAPVAGTLSDIAVDEGIEVEVGALLGVIDRGDATLAPTSVLTKEEIPATVVKSTADITMSPAARKLVDENNLDSTDIEATGKGGRLTKGDVISFLEGGYSVAASSSQDTPAQNSAKNSDYGVTQMQVNPTGPREERVKMTRLRQKIAERLKSAQNTAAILTTFNEIDMSAVAAIRAKYGDTFEKEHGVRLGFMSFFVKACVVALKELPAVNAEIDGSEIVYKNHYDIGVAVGTEKGLVVPVLRDADLMSFSVVEKSIHELGLKASDGKLKIEEMIGGTFTISNGGIYGSMLSTPILNPPQSGILGMHNIIERPVVVKGEVIIRPMMYVALSYDHRIIDGREAVTFLLRVKECIEDPQRIMLNI